MIEAKIRKQGNSYVVTIPRAAMEKYQLREGQQIAFTPTKQELTPVLDPALQNVADDVFKEYKDVFEYLADK
ncbi:MAG TPA: AbrB/MazE/SpoVT family DNA-binding domain-containing protein [Thermomicrobiales bacterium]|nr:AbrB/MazE/SpoVT family DNA-binding domain-containing protein [Thermomicrobiales bacterium]